MNQNPLKHHGAIKLSPNNRYLAHADGTPFFWLADTWWFGLTNRCPWHTFKKLIDKRRHQGFTVIQLVVGVPPETDPFSPQAKNAGGWPFMKTGNKITVNPAYFAAADRRIKYIVEQGIVPCLFGGWGHQIDSLGKRAMQDLWQEIIERFTKLPVIFCLTGEVDGTGHPKEGLGRKTFTRLKKALSPFMPFAMKELYRKCRPAPESLGKTGSLHKQRRLKQWAEIAHFIKRTDPYGRLLTVHPHSQHTTAELFNNPSWLDINAIQSGHSLDRAGFMVSAIHQADQQSHPIINLEPWYEGILGDFGASWQRYAFWLCVLAGAKGHTYGAQGLWQMATKQDRFMKHWGVSDWQTALAYPGGGQLGKAKQFLAKFPWWQLTPDSTRLSPHWTPQTPNLPLAAAFGRHSWLIYFPLQEQASAFTLRVKVPPATWQFQWYNPATMRRQKTEKKQSTQARLNFSRPTVTRDWLLLATPSL